MKKYFLQLKEWLAGLSFRTGVVMLAICLVCYVISFAQAALPISLAWKGGLWVVFFGLAKTFQYAGLIILGKEGFKRFKKYFIKIRKREIDYED